LNLGSIGGSLGGIGNVISGGLHMFGKWLYIDHPMQLLILRK
jgi:hypothetical protein